MKTVITSLALALLVSGTTLAAPGKTADDKKATMQTAVYPSTNSMKLNVIVDNKTNRTVVVRLFDQAGETLAMQYVPKSDKPTHARFDLSELQDGIYQVEINNGYTKEIKQVTLQTKKPASASFRSIAMN